MGVHEGQGGIKPCCPWGFGYFLEPPIVVVVEGIILHVQWHSPGPARVQAPMSLLFVFFLGSRLSCSCARGHEPERCCSVLAAIARSETSFLGNSEDIKAGAEIAFLVQGLVYIRSYIRRVKVKFPCI